MSTIETQEKGVKKVNNKNTTTMSLTSFSVITCGLLPKDESLTLLIMGINELNRYQLD